MLSPFSFLAAIFGFSHTFSHTADLGILTCGQMPRAGETKLFVSVMSHAMGRMLRMHPDSVPRQHCHRNDISRHAAPIRACSGWLCPMPAATAGHTNQVLKNSLIRGCASEPTRVATLSTGDESPADPTSSCAA